MKASGIQFAIIKAGGSDAGTYTDGKWEANYKGAKAAGIPIGAYYFVGKDCVSAAAGKADAERFIRILKGKQLEYPVYMDNEAQPASAKAGITEATIAFCKTMEAAGYFVGIYGSAVSGFRERMDDSSSHPSRTGWRSTQASAPTPASTASGSTPPRAESTASPETSIWTTDMSTTRPSSRLADTTGTRRRPRPPLPEAPRGTRSSPAPELGSAGRNPTGATRRSSTPTTPHKPLARGYAVRYTDAWCATFVSAVAIKCGLTGIIPTECGCGQMVALFQKLGEWVESDAYTPKPGDVIFYDWQDSGSGDNTGWPDHVGIVEKVSGSTITAIEGNKGGAVGRRTLSVNGRYIRGYGVPKYKGSSASTTPASPVVHKKTVEALAKEVIEGKWGNGDDRKMRLTAAGYDYAAVQAKVNALLKTPAAASPVWHTVKSGDTLSAIARRYGTNVSAIQKLNPTLIKDVNLIITGWKIRVK